MSLSVESSKAEKVVVSVTNSDIKEEAPVVRKLSVMTSAHETLSDARDRALSAQQGGWVLPI